jgi:hypothetical protein
MIYFYASRKRVEMMRRIVETLNLKLPTILRRHAKPAPTPLKPEEIAELERDAVRIEVEPEAVKTRAREEKVKSLKTQIESLSSERVKIRGEILSGLAGVIMPIEADGRREASGEEVSFKFRDGMKCPAVTAFIKKELNFGLPPVYVALTSEGLKVVGVDDKTNAVKEVIKAVEGLRVKAAGELKRYTPETLSGKLGEEEETPMKGVFAPFRRLKR